jgi:predicted metal-dependent hydrolase
MDKNDFKDVFLEKKQKELLCIVVEAARNVPSENRQEFSIVRTEEEGEYLQHSGLPDGEIKFSLPDLQILMSEGFIQETGANEHGISRIAILPRGFRFYEYLKKQSGEPVEHVEKEVHDYIDSHEFQKEYPIAYEKWAEAEKLLWETDTSKQLTTIGHLCREAIQEFMDILYTQIKPQGEQIEKHLTKQRLKKVTEAKSKQLGETERKLFDLLHDYWDVLNDLVQRQEHGAQKEKVQLVWKDARRVVFQTMMFMFEVSQSLKLQSYERQ